jgi:ATP-dependent exoDNAse (exonuclease V) alpha subunit
MILSDDQQAAVEQFLNFLQSPNEKIMVLAGHSGTGKSTTIKHMIKAAEVHKQLMKALTNEDQELNIGITATTHKAAKVIGEYTDREARTIHSYLHLKVRNDTRKGKTFLEREDDFQVKENTIVIIDEASMVDSALMKAIDESTLHCKILYVGDPYQLSPVYEKQSPVFQMNYPTATLTTIHRQEDSNPIIEVGEQFRQTIQTKKFSDIPTDSTHIIHCDGPEFKERMEETFLENVRLKSRVIAWTNKRVSQYNSHIRELFIQDKEPQLGEILISNSVTKTVGARNKIGVINDQTIEIYSLYETSYEAIPGWNITINNNTTIFMPKNYEDVQLKLKKFAKAKDWFSYFRVKDHVADLRPPFASTVHKSQGSTFKNVFIDLSDIGRCNIADDVARMLYVAITRSSDKVYLYGELPKKYRS